MAKNYGLKANIKPVTHIIRENGNEYLVVEYKRSVDANGRYIIDFGLYELHDGIADKLLGKGHNPLILEKKYIK